MNNIRNFSIIAHIDHGKSTLSDSLIKICGSLSKREIAAKQILDSMDLERERGITIKAQSVTLYYKAQDSKKYQLNLIDTPGHVDFAYEVSRSLAACEGALLVVDACKGVEAQTLANFRTAIDMNLSVIPVINKIDLQTSDPDSVSKEIEDILCIEEEAVRCSAKTCIGVKELLERVVRDIPQPKGDYNASLQALIIDSWFDNYIGVVSLVRIKNGTLRKGDKVKVMSTGQSYNVERLGIFTPKKIDCDILKCGEVGWLACTIKDILGAPVGDTMTLNNNQAKKALHGFKKIKPKVYAGLFPVISDDYENFRYALEKLSINDASLFYEYENSSILGSGFRCGFLGLLHMEIVKERLEREYNIDIITTSPTVIYEVLTIDNKILYIDSPIKLPSINKIKEIREPIAECNILLPEEYIGNVITICIEKRGIQKNICYHKNNVKLTYEIPMSEVILDFFNCLKSNTRGYASLDYEFKCFNASDMVRMDLLINGERVDALSLITHRDRATYIGRKFVDNILELIPRQQFTIAIQAAIGNHIIARSTVKPLRKDVIAKCYGGDVSRKKKLLKKQKEGKKRMKKLGKIYLPHEAFLAILDIGKKYK